MSTSLENFRAGYTKLLNACWEDAAAMEAAKANPGAALASAGLEAPAGSTVHIKAPAADSGTLEDQLAAWNAGGEITLYFPSEQPSFDLDDSQLEGVSGGGDVTGCCCCSPCCSCT